jgi:hypothetical protein
MQGRQQICILCRNIGRPARNILHGRREASQLRSLEPYDASKLLLDLDTPENKHVREYKHEHSVQLPPSAVRKKGEAETKAQEKGFVKQEPRNVPDIYRPTPMDFMRYALTDDEWDWSKKGRNGSLRRILLKCLPFNLGGYEDHIKWLRAYEVLPYKVDKLLQGPEEAAVQGIESTLRDNKSVYALRRITSLLTRSVEGCKFVASNASLFLSKTRTRTEATLKYINSVIQRLETMGVDAGSDWYRAGLKSALKLAHSPAIKKYVDIAVRRKDVLKLPKTLEHTVDWSSDAMNLKRVRDINGDGSEQDDLLKLLTGWESSGVPNGDEQQKPCIALLVKDDLEMQEACISALDKLGAYEALGYILSHIDPASRSASLALSAIQRFNSPPINFKNPLQTLKLLKERKPVKTILREEPTSSNNAHQTPPNNTDVASSNNAPVPSKSILSILELSQARRKRLRRALAEKYLRTESCDIDENALLRDLEGLDLYTSDNMSDILSILSAYWTQTEDQTIRKLVSDLGPGSPKVQQAMIEIDRRLKVLGGAWEVRDDISNWYVKDDLERLTRLRDDLHSS